MKRYSFTRCYEEVVYAETEEDARAELTTREPMDYGDFLLEDVEDA